MRLRDLLLAIVVVLAIAVSALIPWGWAIPFEAPASPQLTSAKP
jgi:hypothetical protein